MKLGKTGRKIAMSFEPWQQLEALAMILYWVCGWFVMSVVVFFRKDFGERYLSWINLFFGYIVVGLFTGSALSLWNASNGSPVSAIMGAFYLAFVAASIAHRVAISRKNKAGQEWHSLYSGTPLLPVPVPTEIMNKWVEPALLGLLGILMTLLHIGMIAIWLFIAALALALHEQISYHLQRQQLLDLRDARIEAKYWQAAMSGKPAKESKGFVIASSNIELLDRSPGLRDAFSSLAPELQSIMDRPEAA